jgi:hypothetical protein
MVGLYRAFASHINVPKGNWDVYHKPFKDTCIESDIVIDDCKKNAQTSESTISYKHVNFCGALRVLDLANRITSKRIIVSTTGMKKLECGIGL